MNRTKATEVLQFFSYAHLPPLLQAPSKAFCELARTMADQLPDNSQKQAALEKLLEAKDCAVRALLFKEPVPEPLPEPRREHFETLESIP